MTFRWPKAEQDAGENRVSQCWGPQHTDCDPFLPSGCTCGPCVIREPLPCAAKLYWEILKCAVMLVIVERRPSNTVTRSVQALSGL